MRRAEWVAPLAVGLLVAGGAWLLAPPAHDSEATAPAGVRGEAEPPMPWAALWPRPDTPAAPMTVLHVAANDAGEAYGVTLVRGDYEAGEFRVPRTPCDPVVVIEFCGSTPHVLPVHPDAAPSPGPVARFGDPGLDVVRVTVHGFLADGRLVFTNDAADASRYEAADRTDLPATPFYLGDGPAPAGALGLPAWVKDLMSPLRQDLAGLPVGGVASALLDAQIVQDIFGEPVYVTARIDSLTSATSA